MPKSAQGPVASIRRFEVRGFRSIRQLTWRPGSINVLIGENAAGKSNILAAAAMLQASASGELPRFMDDWGGALRLAHDSLSAPMEFEVELVDPDSDPEDPNPELGMEHRLKIQPVCDAGDFRIGAERLHHGARSAVTSEVTETFPIRWVADDYPTSRRETLLAEIGIERHAHPAVRNLRSILMGWQSFAGFRTDRRCDVQKLRPGESENSGPCHGRLGPSARAPTGGLRGSARPCDPNERTG